MVLASPSPVDGHVAGLAQHAGRCSPGSGSQAVGRATFVFAAIAPLPVAATDLHVCLAVPSSVYPPAALRSVWPHFAVHTRQIQRVLLRYFYFNKLMLCGNINVQLIDVLNEFYFLVWWCEWLFLWVLKYF